VSLALIGMSGTAVASFVAFRLAHTAQGAGSIVDLVMVHPNLRSAAGDLVLIGIAYGALSILPPASAKALEIGAAALSSAHLLSFGLVSIAFGAACGLLWGLSSESATALMPATVLPMFAMPAVGSLGGWTLSSALSLVVPFVIVFCLATRQMRYTCASGR